MKYIKFGNCEGVAVPTHPMSPNCNETINVAHLSRADFISSFQEGRNSYPGTFSSFDKTTDVIEDCFELEGIFSKHQTQNSKAELTFRGRELSYYNYKVIPAGAPSHFIFF